ncbi:hypothetical protein CL622_02370 [archaeon]|nr:hypothetical protein [archaeon]
MTVMKYRRKILTQKSYIKYFVNLVDEIGARYEFEIDELGCDSDHVHILLFVSPCYIHHQK